MSMVKKTKKKEENNEIKKEKKWTCFLVAAAELIY